jgi:hypothetical protein
MKQRLARGAGLGIDVTLLTDALPLSRPGIHAAVRFRTERRLVGHVAEQEKSGRLIRPAAKYLGPLTTPRPPA